MPSGLFSRSNFIVHDTLPGRQAAFSLFSEHTKTLVYILLLGSFWSHLVFMCQSSYVVLFFEDFFISHNFPLCFRIRLFFFLSGGATASFLRFNVTPSANFLVCSKCVIGDSQQDRNARAYFLVKL